MRYDLLSVLLKGINHLPGSILCLITSRPAKKKHHLPLLDHLVVSRRVVISRRLEPGNSESNNHDIRLFLEARYEEVRQEYYDLFGEDPQWPRAEAKEKMFQKAGGLFIWAATAVRFLMDNSVRDPRCQLERLLGYPHDDMVELDNLYDQILAPTCLRWLGCWSPFATILGR